MHVNNLKLDLHLGDMYWRYNEFTGHMDYDYPRDMKMWKGVPLPVDSAFQFWDGQYMLILQILLSLTHMRYTVT